MEGFIALEKFMQKDILPFGAGVSVSQDEDIARFESSRLQFVKSFNNWFFVNFPDRSFYLDIEKPVDQQSPEVISYLSDRDFIMKAFIYEARNLFDTLDEKTQETLEEGNRVETVHNIFDDFVKEKTELLMGFNTGEALFRFINSKCRGRNTAKSSSLLCDAGIKGCIYHDDTGERFLVFDARNDLTVLEQRSARL